jgi:acyl-CoA synthetase (AMP-forming)/AMP-acid ligase II
MRPYHLLTPSDNIAISDATTELTYTEFIQRIHEINHWYKSMGYGPGHRLSVVGPNTVQTYLYLFAAALDMCATTLPWGGTKAEWQFRLDANNSNAIVFAPVHQIEHLHYNKSTVLDKEIMLYYSSGTSHPYGWQKSYPVPYELDDNNWGTAQDVTHYYRDQGNPWYRNPQTNRTINTMAPYVGWGQEVTFTTIARGGHVHLLQDAAEYDRAAQHVKPTWLAGFPLAWQKVIDKNKGSHKIQVFEYSGGKLIPGQKEQFENFFGHTQWICGYGDAATGMTFVNYTNNFEHIGKPIQCLSNTGADFRISDSGTIEFRGIMTPNHDWWDTGDLAEIDQDGNWHLLGRANELIIIRGGGKVYPFEVESLLIKHPQVDEIYVYPQPDDKLLSVPACVYHGDIKPVELAQWAKGVMAQYKLPVRWTQLVSNTLHESDKISRTNMHTTLENNAGWINEEHISS